MRESIEKRAYSGRQYDASKRETESCFENEK